MAMKIPLIVILGIVILAGSCARENRQERGWEPGTVLRIGTDATYPPFEIVDTEAGEPVGFDIDIINAVCRENGWEPHLIVTPFDGIISGLKSKKYDCIISAMSITPQREAVVAFSEPYYLAGQVIAVPVTDSLIYSALDLRGRRVGVQLGTTGERMAKTLAGVSVFSFDNIGAAFIDMENGQIDAVINDMPTTREYIKRRGNAKIVGKLLSEEYYGIAVRKQDSRLLQKIDAALQIIMESGEYDEIERKWFF
ncbi:MAG: basic amino acid ABC transporter substrate-binding protein [Candidatus Zixiibacteriota bacterium]|nr:MAG: basic amino acid ABC transporter substrate-binding protein [candidate division Zixibacteria bacterium]